MGDEGASIVADLFKQNNTITCIDFHYNGVGSEGIVKIVDALNHNHSVTKFYTLQYESKTWNYIPQINEKVEMNKNTRKYNITKEIILCDVGRNKIFV